MVAEQTQKPNGAGAQAPPQANATTSDILIPVVVHARVVAWPENLQHREGAYLLLQDALSEAFPSDVHFAAYSCPDKPPRLKNEALPLLGEGSVVDMVLMVFDIDCEEAHRDKVPAPDSWFATECTKLERLGTTWPGIFVARSKGGYRIVYRLAKPFPICDDAAKAAWTLYYRGCCAYLAREFGIVADPACADWTRLYRVPHATRDPQIGPEQRDVYGTPHDVGLWDYHPERGVLDADIAVAATIAKNDEAWRGRVLKPLLRCKSELEGTPLPPSRRAPRSSTGRASYGEAIPGINTTPAAEANGATTQGASAWLAKQAPAIEGSGGDYTTYKVALGLVKGHSLPLSVALDLLVREYNPRCLPPWTLPALEHKVKSAQRAPVPDGYLLREGEKSVVVVTTAEHEVVDQVETALAARGGLYQRGGMLVHVVRDGRRRGVATAGDLQRPPRSPRIVEASIPRLREEMTRVVVFQSRGVDGRIALVHPPKWAPEGLSARGHWRGIPHLEGIVEAPVLRPDGQILQAPGYDASTGLLFEPNAIYLPVGDAPSMADAKKAAGDLHEAFCDFPFVGPEHWSALLAALLSPFAQFAYEGPAPMVAIDAPAAGTGKSLLADTISTIATGRAMSRMSQASNEDEERKRITSIALAGDRLVLLDNVTRPLGSGALDAALTGEEWSDRHLGLNKMVRLRLRILWFTTGNNLQLVGDTARRILNVRLDARVEQPEQRTTFKHPNLLAWLRQERPRLVHAALTILRAFFAAGCPVTNLSGWGSFEDWSRVVRGAVIFAGLKDPAETRNELRGRADLKAGARISVLEGIETLCGSNWLEASEIVDRINGAPQQHRRLYAALLELRPLRAGHTFNAAELAYTLRAQRDVTVGDRRLVAEMVSDRLRWRVERMGINASPSPHASNTNAVAGRAAAVGSAPAADAPAVPLAVRLSHEEEQRHFESLNDQMLEHHLAGLAREHVTEVAPLAKTGGGDVGTVPAAMQRTSGGPK